MWFKQLFVCGDRGAGAGRRAWPNCNRVNELEALIAIPSPRRPRCAHPARRVLRTSHRTPHATHCFNIICLKFTAHKNIRLLWSHMFVTTCYKQCRQFLSLIYSYYTCIFIFVSTVIRLELLAQIKNNIVYLCVQHNYWIISKIFLIIIAMLHPE